MNKVFIRTRQIDNNKQLPILLKENDDLSDFNEYSNISKSSQILSGMDKGEESEHHLQEVLRELQYDKPVFDKAIPIPEVSEEPSYEALYKSDFKLPKNYIRLKTLDFEDELPEYDLDEEDKEWLENSKLNVSTLKFEQIVEQFEKACCQKALLLDEAKSLLRHEAVHLVIAIYDYWLTKRVYTGQALILSVKAEKAERCNNTPIDPYIAFRKRSERMTTRKNRRVDEASYEKMFRLRCQMEKLGEIMQLVSKRETTKSQITLNERDLFIKRYECRDYDKLQLKESEIAIKRQTIKLGDNFKSAQRSREENHKEPKRKRSYSKTFETAANQSSTIEHQSEDIDFTFRPMSKCKYLPSKLTMNDANTSHYHFDESPNTSKSFSLSKLSSLPESYHNLSTPIRFRMNSNRMLSIDLQSKSSSCLPSSFSTQRFWPIVQNQHHSNPILSAFESSNYLDDNSNNNNNNNNSQRSIDMMLLHSSKSANPLIQKLVSLYNRNIHCGLLPLNYDFSTDASANNSRQISSSIPKTRIPTNSATVTKYSLSLTDEEQSVPPNHSNHHQNHSYHNNPHNQTNRNDIEGLNRQNNRTEQGCLNKRKLSSEKDNNFYSLPYTKIHKNGVPLVSPVFYNSKLSLSNSTFLSNNCPANCTYQTSSLQPPPSSLSPPPYSIYDIGKNCNEKCAFIESDRRHMLSNGQHFHGKPTTMTMTTTTTKVSKDNKDLVESQSNNNHSSSLSSVGVDDDFKRHISKVGLKCFKSLTNKQRVIPRKDIDEIANFYSKSNGHHQHSWLNQKNVDSCLKPNNLLPLWKSESHVMTGVNKMT